MTRHFPARNRIVSGLCHGVVVVEAAERSGTLITARTAADQGREVLAVPGHPLDPRAADCNLLLRDGATLVRSVEDVVEAIAPSLARWADDTGASPIPPAPVPAAQDRPAPDRSASPPPAKAGSGDFRDRVLDRLGPSPLPRTSSSGISAKAPPPLLPSSPS